MNDSEKRVEAVRMTREVINPLFRGDMAMMCGLPDDAEFRRFYRDGARDLLIFVFESDEFEPVDGGEPIPERTAYARSVDADVRRETDFIEP